MNKKLIKNFLEDFSEDINKRNLNFVYRKWLFDDIAPVKVLTELFFQSGIDPLKYTSTVPIYYAKESDKVDSLFIPSNVKEIGVEAFKDSNLRQLIFSEPAECKLIDHRAFSGTLLKKIVFPDSMREIGVEAFQGCAELEEVSLPNIWGFNILTGVFKDCPKLTTIQYRGTAEEYRTKVYGCNWTVGSSIKYLECTDQIIKF